LLRKRLPAYSERALDAEPLLGIVGHDARFESVTLRLDQDGAFAALDFAAHAVAFVSAALASVQVQYSPDLASAWLIDALAPPAALVFADVSN
jgi:hypothetical protein